MDRNKPPLIGVVGGIASGKSYVAEQLQHQGAVVISADRLAHEVLRQGDVKQAVRARWGDAILSADGEVDREALGRIVFAPAPDGPRELKYLEQLTHPKIGEIIWKRVVDLREQNTVAAIVLDVPLMLEAGWNRFCDRIVFVDAPRAVRWRRASERGWSEDGFARREAAQESLETKRKLADVIIDNSGSPASVKAQLEHVWPSLLGLSPSREHPPECATGRAAHELPGATKPA